MQPPKPRLVLRVGVTGHRPRLFGDAAQAIVRQKLDVIFADLREAAMALHAREAKVFDPALPELRVVSALAEGADRVVAEAGLQAGFALDAVLPFPTDIYESDFKTAESKTRYRDLLKASSACLTLPGTKSPTDESVANRAYEAGGLITLRQCDIVITIWDGKEASGRGGTEDIVQHAITTGRPVLRFDAGGNGPFLLMASSAEPVDARDLATRAATGPVMDKAAVDNLVEHLCAPPAPSAKDEPHRQKVIAKSNKSLRRFLGEGEHRYLIFAFAYPLLLSLLSDKKGFWRSFLLPRYVAATEAEWKDYWSELAAAGPAICDPIRQIIMLRFAWTDKLANFYGQLHRSGYVGNFILAALAVLFAAIGVWWSQVLELATIIVIVAFTSWGMFVSWHDRWVDYRQLSAQLRHLRALALTGSSTSEARTPHNDDELQAGPIWVSWYYRMTLRELGMLNTKVDEAYLDIARRAIGKGEIADQVDYHRKNAKRMHSILVKLEWVGYGAFLATLLVCACEVFGGSLSKPLLEWLHGFSVVLPALGAALFGIRVQGDFDGSARRSTDMELRLSPIADRLNGKDPISFAELSALTEYAAIVMAGEVGDWGFVYRARPLALPT